MSMRRPQSFYAKDTPEPELPGVLKGAEFLNPCTLAEVPNPGDLTKWFLDHGLETSDWGSGDTKTVKKFWEEIKANESGLELWKKPDGQLQPVRVTHVLRAKVSSPDSFKRRVFLFNTWQQFGDGRKRIRNGLLSEKLSTAEMPLQEHLHDVCGRAVVEEEMQRLADPLLKIGPHSPAPEYDPSYVCPLSVVDEYFVDHVIEVEASKSYPRLLTMYHLYTVEIVCTGLPIADFNTLEFDHPDEKGRRKLKYVHAWVWMEWPQIQRYLFEGSSMKERKGKGSFDDATSLLSWLQAFNLELDMWGQGSCRSVEQLFNELEEEESQLELWGRHDGVPLLMRVLHVIQLKVHSTDARNNGKFLFHTMCQTTDGQERNVNRLLAKKMNIVNFPFTQKKLAAESMNLVREQLTYFAEPHFRLCKENPTSVKNLDVARVEVRKINFVNHRVDVEKSRTFKGLSTLYYLYTCEVECDGLPHANFTSLEVRNHKTSSGTGGTDIEPYVEMCNNYCWVSWQQCLDMLHSSNSNFEDQLEFERKSHVAHRELAKAHGSSLDELIGGVRNLMTNPSIPKEVVQNMEKLLKQACLDQQANERKCEKAISENTLVEPLSRRLPPSMISEITKEILTTDDKEVNEDTPGDLCSRVRRLLNNSMSCNRGSS